MAWAHGPVDHWKQTVPISELTAAIQSVIMTSGPLVLVVDAMSVVTGIKKGPLAPHQTNKQLWARFWSVAAGRQIEVHKIKSHQTPEQASRLEWTPSIGWPTSMQMRTQKRGLGSRSSQHVTLQKCRE